MAANKPNTLGSFGTFVPEVKENPYIETMREFAKAAETSPDVSWSVDVDAARETAERTLIAEAAHTVNKTARLRKRDDSHREHVGNREKTGNPIYKGVVTLTFTLSEKHKARRGANKA